MGCPSRRAEKSCQKTGKTRNGQVTVVLFLVVISVLLPGKVTAAPDGEFPISDRMLYLYSGGPGARSLGLGAAFIALADDVSAIEWNPAGLGHQRHFQVLVEVNNRSNPIAGFADPNFSTADNSYANSLNIALSYPSRYGSVGFSIFHSASWKQSWNWSEKEAHDNFLPFSFDNMRTESSLDIYNFGLAYGYTFSPYFSVGLTTRFHQLLKKYRFTVLDDNGDYVWLKEVDTSRYDFSFVLGTIIKPFHWFNLGLVVKTPAQIHYYELMGDGNRKTDYISLPFNFGVGLAIRPMRYILLSGDIVYSQYSEMGRGSSLVDRRPSEPEEIILQSEDDGWDYHVGMEVMLPFRVNQYQFICAPRWGYYRAQPYNLYYERTFADAPEYEEIFPKYDSEDRYTMGLGIRYSEYQCDIAVEMDEHEYRAFSVTMKSFVPLKDIVTTILEKMK